MSSVGLPRTSNRSALLPEAMTPRSASRSRFAESEVADCNASTGVKAQCSTYRAISRCTAAPRAVPWIVGPESVPLSLQHQLAHQSEVTTARVVGRQHKSLNIPYDIDPIRLQSFYTTVCILDAASFRRDSHTIAQKMSRRVSQKLVGLGTTRPCLCSSQAHHRTDGGESRHHEGISLLVAGDHLLSMCLIEELMSHG